MILPCRILGCLCLTVLIILPIGKGTISAKSISTESSTFPEIADAPHSCSSGNASSCIVDSYIGSKIIFEDETTRIWNFTLGPGEMTSMHRHDCGYHFLAVTSTVLEVWGEMGEKLITFGDFLIQTASDTPLSVPRVHAAKNVGQGIYNEILYESKSGCESNGPDKDEL